MQQHFFGGTTQTNQRGYRPHKKGGRPPPAEVDNDVPLPDVGLGVTCCSFCVAGSSEGASCPVFDVKVA